MCKEIDDGESDMKTQKKRSKPTLEETQMVSNSFSLPEPGKPPNLPAEMIVIPAHATGLVGDPLQIQDMEELVDLDLSEMSGGK